MRAKELRVAARREKSLVFSVESGRGGGVNVKRSGVLVVRLTCFDHRVWSHSKELNRSILRCFSKSKNTLKFEET